jgi:hypothetical protein
MTSAHRVAILRELTQHLAYGFWVERGQPVGSPEVDWFQAEILVERVRWISSLESCEITGFQNIDHQRSLAAPAPVLSV